MLSGHENMPSCRRTGERPEARSPDKALPGGAVTLTTRQAACLLKKGLLFRMTCWQKVFLREHAPQHTGERPPPCGIDTCSPSGASAWAAAVCRSGAAQGPGGPAVITGRPRGMEAGQRPPCAASCPLPSTCKAQAP